MDTLLIKVKNAETYQHLLWLLKRFDQSEIQVIEHADSFNTIKQTLQAELERIDTGKSDLMDMDDFDDELEKIIASYED